LRSIACPVQSHLQALNLGLKLPIFISFLVEIIL
jgi:hypothetical protein